MRVDRAGGDDDPLDSLGAARVPLMVIVPPSRRSARLEIVARTLERQLRGLPVSPPVASKNSERKIQLPAAGVDVSA